MGPMNGLNAFERQNPNDRSRADDSTECGEYSPRSREALGGGPRPPQLSKRPDFVAMAVAGSRSLSCAVSLSVLTGGSDMRWATRRLFRICRGCSGRDGTVSNCWPRDLDLSRGLRCLDGRQLQHRRTLTLAQTRNQHDLAVGKF